MSRIGLGRHGLLEENAGDPLDGLVNLFDLGLVLAVAFLVAGLGLTLASKPDERGHDRSRTAAERVIDSPGNAPEASGRGLPVGQVYRLPDGRLVYVKGGSR